MRYKWKLLRIPCTREWESRTCITLPWKLEERIPVGKCGPTRFEFQLESGFLFDLWTIMSRVGILLNARLLVYHFIQHRLFMYILFNKSFEITLSLHSLAEEVIMICVFNFPPIEQLG